MSWELVTALAAGVLSAALLGWAAFQSILPKIKFSQTTKISTAKAPLDKAQKILLGGLALCLLVSLLVDFFFGVVLLALFLLGWFAWQKGPTWKRDQNLKKKQNKMLEVFPQALGMAIQALKTGQTVPQVLEYLSRESPSPLREELAAVCAEMDLGASAETALAKMGDRFPNFSEFHQFLESYRISRQTGANLTHLLQVLVEGLEEKNRILRKMDAMTAQARLSGLMIGALPFLLASVFFVMDPSLILPLFTSKTGWVLLALAAILETIGFAWIQQLLKLEI